MLGAIYIDQGYSAAEKFIAGNLFPYIDEVIAKRLWQDAKSHFQEKAQDRAGITPAYKVLREEGPDHEKIFTVGVFLKEELAAEGDGSSKQEAEQEAAKNALEKIWLGGGVIIVSGKGRPAKRGGLLPFFAFIQNTIYVILHTNLCV